jgi:uncharacterized coiled-coil protein SlyX
VSRRRLIARALGLAGLERRLAEQDAVLAELRAAVAGATAEHERAAAELRLALDEAVLALDRRLLDLYGLVATARDEAGALAADVRELTAPEGAVAEIVAAEAARLDSYLAHHAAELRTEIAALRGTAGEPPPRA